MREIRFSNRAKEITLWAGVAFFLFLLYRTGHVLSPFIWAIIATYLFHPLVTFMVRTTGVPRIIWVILIYIAMFSLIAWTVINIAPIILEQTGALVEEAPRMLEDVEAWSKHQPLLQDLGIELNLESLQQETSARASDIAGLAEQLALPVIEVVFDQAIKLFVFLIATFYLLLNAENIMAFFIGMAPRPYQHEIESLLRRINDNLGAYLRSQLILIAIMSIATFIFLSVIQVRYALVVGILTGFLEIIPIIGPYTAGAIAVSVALTQPTTPFGWSHVTLAIVVAVGYFVLRQLEDNLIIPTLIGRVVHLNPIIVIFALLVGASEGGILGLLIAVPVASVIRILAQYLYTKVLSREPPTVVSIGSLDDPLERLEEAAHSGAKRLILVSADPNKQLQEHSTYQRLAHLIHNQDLDVTLISSDAIACGLATTHGVRIATNAV